ncbi:MAG: flagellar motor protein MotB [Phycisphaerae bacterium]
MTRLTMGTVAAGLAMIVLSAIGCTDPKDQRIKDLQNEKNILESSLKDAQIKYAEAVNQNTLLKDQQAKDAAEIARLRRAGTPGPGPGPGPSAGGWESGHFGDRLTLETDVLFASGKAELTAAGKGRLDKVAADLKKTYAGMPVLVYGYTDTDPIKKTKDIWEDNLDLSAARAMTVTRYLISKGISSAKIETIAMGEWHPLATKDKSRRVEIVVVKNPPAK